MCNCSDLASKNGSFTYWRSRVRYYSALAAKRKDLRLFDNVPVGDPNEAVTNARASGISTPGEKPPDHEEGSRMEWPQRKRRTTGQAVPVIRHAQRQDGLLVSYWPVTGGPVYATLTPGVRLDESHDVLTPCPTASLTATDLNMEDMP
jgi:hypothetical protein